MAELNKTQMDVAVKDTVVEALSPAFEAVGASKIGNYVYAFPVTVEGEETYAKVTITAVQRKDTKTHPAFNLEDAITKYERELAEKAEKAAARVAEREAKKASK